MLLEEICARRANLFIRGRLESVGSLPREFKTHANVRTFQPILKGGTGKLEDRKIKSRRAGIFLSLNLPLVWLRPKAAPSSSILCVEAKLAHDAQRHGKIERSKN
jgi:hypothetical protein